MLLVFYMNEWLSCHSECAHCSLYNCCVSNCVIEQSALSKVLGCTSYWNHVNQNPSRVEGFTCLLKGNQNSSLFHICHATIPTKWSVSLYNPAGLEQKSSQTILDVTVPAMIVLCMLKQFLQDLEFGYSSGYVFLLNVTMVWCERFNIHSPIV